VTHPNVCRIFDFGLHAPGGADAPLPFLTMELLTGVTLAAHIRERRPLAAAEMIDIARQLAAGLHAAHGVEVIHKDLKADNVILIGEATGARRAVITDFGLAATRALVESARETVTHFSGTPGYVAPERLAGAPVTESTDVYSLGVVMTDMITGALPSERADQPLAVPPTGGVEAPLARLARRCQALDARARPSLPEVLRALGELPRPPDAGRGRALRWGAATIGVLSLAASLAFSRSRARAPAVPSLPVGEATLAAVAPPPLRAEPPAAPAATPALPLAPRPRPSPPRRRRTVAPAPAGRDDPAAETLRGAEERLGTGRIGEACALGQVAAGQAPRSPAVWEFLGRCYMRLPDPQEARACYRKYLELAPDGPRASLIRTIVDRETR
jgi:serine/threonine protein kinase